MDRQWQILISNDLGENNLNNQGQQQRDLFTATKAGGLASRRIYRSSTHRNVPATQPPPMIKHQLS